MRSSSPMSELERRVRLVRLYDLYGSLLSPSQRKAFESRYLEDLSLGEMAEEEGVSRAGIQDAVKKAERKLEECEDKLGFLGRVEKVLLLLEEGEDEEAKEVLRDGI